MVIFKFQNEGYVEAQDQVLRNFLNGLVIYKRGWKNEDGSFTAYVKKG